MSHLTCLYSCLLMVRAQRSSKCQLYSLWFHPPSPGFEPTSRHEHANHYGADKVWGVYIMSYILVTIFAQSMLQRILILYYTHSSLSSAIITLKMYEYYTGCFKQIVGASLSYGGCINKTLILIEFESHSWRGVLNTTLCDKICQRLATGRCFFLGTFYQ